MTASPHPHLAPDNPLLSFPGLPRFGDIEPAHVTPAIASLLAEVEPPPVPPPAIRNTI